MDLWTRACITPVAHTYVCVWSESHILKIIFKIYMYNVRVIFYLNDFVNHMSIAVIFMKLYRYYCQSNDEYVGEKTIYPSESYLPCQRVDVS